MGSPGTKGRTATVGKFKGRSETTKRLTHPYIRARTVRKSSTSLYSEGFE